MELMRIFRLAALALLAFPVPFAAAQQPVAEPPTVLEGPQTPGTVPARRSAEPSLMSNDTVLRMHQAGLADDLILQTIATQPGRYDTTPDALISLKQAGLSDPVLAAMSNKARRQITGTPPAEVQVSPVNEIGVYFKDKNGQWQPMESEAVHVKSGGFVKSTLTRNIIKEDRNGVVSGREASLLLPRPDRVPHLHPGGRHRVRVRARPLSPQLQGPRVPCAHRRRHPLDRRRAAG